MTTGGNPVGRLLRWCWNDIRSGETIDLWALVAASVAFTVLGAIGIANVQVLSSVVLGLLALLAVSQIRGREEIRKLVASWHRNRTAVFEADFPAAYYEARSQATHSYAFAGLTMGRTLPTMQSDLVRILDHGGSVRILLPDPANLGLLHMVAASRRFEPAVDDLAAMIRQSIAMAKALPGAAGSQVEVRVTSLLPRVGLNLIDTAQPNGCVMVQMYQTKPSGEAAPIFVLTPTDSPWFDRFCREFEELWDRGTAC